MILSRALNEASVKEKEIDLRLFLFLISCLVCVSKKAVTTLLEAVDAKLDETLGGEEMRAGGSSVKLCMTFVFITPQSCPLLKLKANFFFTSLVDETKCLMEELMLPFLLIRQTSFESPSLTYEKWFSSSFGTVSTTKAQSKRSFGLLVKFLASLVPYEPASFLKVRNRKCKWDYC